MHTLLSFQLFTGSFCKDGGWGTKRSLLQRTDYANKMSFQFLSNWFLRHEIDSVPFYLLCYFIFFSLGVSLLWRKSGCPKGSVHWFSSVEHCFFSKYLSYLSQSLLKFLCLSDFGFHLRKLGEAMKVYLPICHSKADIGKRDLNCWIFKPCNFRIPPDHLT